MVLADIIENTYTDIILKDAIIGLQLKEIREMQKHCISLFVIIKIKDTKDSFL